MNIRANEAQRLVALLTVAILLNYIDRGNLATAAPVLKDELVLSSSQIGVLLSAFFWTYAPCQLLAGWLVHRFEPRFIIAAGVAVWSLAMALTGLAQGFLSLLVLRLMLGIGESVTFPGCQLLVARHIPEQIRGRVTGFIGSGQGLGPMLGTLFGGLALAEFGWRSLFLVLGTITFLWLWPWLMVTRGRFEQSVEPIRPPQVTYRAILGQRCFWGTALGHFCCNYTFYFVLSWLPTFLVKAGGFSLKQMAEIGAVIYLIYSLSTMVSGVATDRLIQAGHSTTAVRKTFIVLSLFGSAVTILCSAYVDPRHSVWLLGLAGVFFGLGTPMIYAIGATLAGPRAAGRWFGAQNLAGQCAGILGPLLTGYIVELTGGFSAAFVICAGTAMIGVAAWGIVVQDINEVQWNGDAAHTYSNHSNSPVP
jgi:MFS family permease